MFSRLSLTKKVILLVAVPLVLELGFIGLLANALNQVEQERRAANHAHDLATQLNVFLRMTMDALVSSILYYFSRDDGVWHRSEDVSHRLKTQIELIRQVCIGHPEELAEIDRIMVRAKEGEHIGQNARNYLKDGNRDAALDEWAKLKVNFKAINHEAEQLVDVELRIEQARGAAVERYEKQVGLILTIGVLVNLIAAVLLVMGFNRSLIGRLIVLSDNTVRLASGKALNPPVSGDDEISRLDKFFRNMADALAAAREKEKEIEQLKQEFVAMVSHDLRTPLSSIRVFHSALHEGVYGSITERGKESLTLIEKEVERLINMVNDLLNMEKLESGKLELELASLDVNSFLRRSADAVENLAADKRVQLEVAGVGEPRSIEGDEERLLQVMINLIGNAIKFADEGSSIALSAHSADGKVEFQVCDRNRAIPEELRTSIFDRFRQVELADSKNNKGTGLGLAICKAIVERHGGTIGVRARPDGGNVFWFTIPQAGSLPSSVAAGGSPHASVPVVAAGGSPLPEDEPRKKAE